MNFSGFTTEYLLECLSAWRALDPLDGTARAIEAELRDRGVDCPQQEEGLADEE